ncbi:MAG: glycoside hydrolase family 52 protein [Cytophagales bacterium]|nr:glycoside hydrolase family 52 protein [Cytophagales bacterium]MDW8383578.1 glycoside hydrolase family 52 protein [Flammeovirgaceae bacterium]
MKWKIVVFLLLIYDVIYSQNSRFFLDTQIPLIPFTDTTQLSILNARNGSRFSFSFLTGEQGIHTGALGFDSDAFSELLLEVQTSKGRYCFRTCGLPYGAQYLLNQQIRLGMTSVQLSGTTPDGLLVIVTIVSPFTPCDSLGDTTKLKVQIAPVYYILSEIFNRSGKYVEGNIKVGFQKIAYEYGRGSAVPSWRFDGRKRNELYFKDEGTSEKTLLSLVSLSHQKHQHIKINSFHTLKVDFSLANGQNFIDTVAYTAYHPDKVIRDKKYNMDLKFYYTRFFRNIQEVNEYARRAASLNLDLSARFEKILSRSKIAPEEKWVIALAFHSDNANAFLLIDEKQRPRFLLLEGRFRHMSTIDVAHETELMALFSPYRLKLQLDMWLDYLARKEVWTWQFENEWGNVQHKEGMSASEYGPFLEHDVGDYPFVAETSEYSFGPHMAVEENCNFALLLYWYWKLMSDDEFVKSHLGMLDVLLHSVVNRDTDDSGLADKGVGWSSYDVNDAIKQSPENVYLGVKQLCAYEVAAEMFEKLAIKELEPNPEIKDIKSIKDGEGKGYFESIQLANEKLRYKQAMRYRAEARKIVNSLVKAFGELGYLPVSLDRTFRGWNQYSITIPEALFLPGLSGFSSATIQEIIPMLSTTYQLAYQKSLRSYGVNLSSEESVTWFSKTMVSDIVASYWFGLKPSTAIFAYRWNKNNPDAYNDGALGNRPQDKWNGFWYPRGISALGYLLREQQFRASQRLQFLEELR